MEGRREKRKQLYPPRKSYGAVRSERSGSTIPSPTVHAGEVAGNHSIWSRLRGRKRGQQTVDVLLRIEHGDREAQPPLPLDDRRGDARLFQLPRRRRDILQLKRDDWSFRALGRHRRISEGGKLFLEPVGELTGVGANVHQSKALDVLERSIG